MVNVFVAQQTAWAMLLLASLNYVSAFPPAPILLNPCPSYLFPSVLLSFHYLSSLLLLSSAQSSVLATPSIIPTQGELEAGQAPSLEARLGEFQHCSPGFTPGLWA